MTPEFSTMNYIQLLSSGKSHVKISFCQIICYVLPGKPGTSLAPALVPSLLSPEHPKPSLIPLLPFQKDAAFWDMHSWFQPLPWSQTFPQGCPLGSDFHLLQSDLLTHLWIRQTVTEHLLCARQYLDSQDTKVKQDTVIVSDVDRCCTYYEFNRCTEEEIQNQIQERKESKEEHSEPVMLILKKQELFRWITQGKIL